MHQTCKNCNIQFEITNKELDLYAKFNQEPLKVCFECHQKHMLSFRNERNLYQRKCDATGENIISIYSSGSPHTIYKRDYWYSDKWDPIQYGQDYDFSRSFFDQFKELLLKVPKLNLINGKAENSDYCNMTVGNKNCYLVFGGDFNQDCLYGTLCMENRDSIDVDYSNNNEVSYSLIDSHGCYGSQFVFDSKNCNDCFYISDCINSNNCILSTNLVNRQYCILNKQYSKEEYEKMKAQILTPSWNQQIKNLNKLKELRSKRVVKYSHIINSENCSGDYIVNSKSCHNSYDISDCEDFCNVIFGVKSKDIFNSCLIGHGSELAYSSWGCLGLKNVKFSWFNLNSSDLDYCNACQSSQNLFACIALRRKRYCILNKQYSKDEYFELRGRIIEHMKSTGEWGQFFRKDLSPFSYNESTADIHYPLSKEDAIQQGFTWKDKDKKEYQPSNYTIADNINDVKDGISNNTLACKHCSKNYRITPGELNFYRKFQIAVPRHCPECRYLNRMSWRTPKKLWDRQCQKCSTNIKSTYSPNRSENVHCEKCYLEIVY